ARCVRPREEVARRHSAAMLRPGPDSPRTSLVPKGSGCLAGFGTDAAESKLHRGSDTAAREGSAAGELARFAQATRPVPAWGSRAGEPSRGVRHTGPQAQPALHVLAALELVACERRRSLCGPRCCGISIRSTTQTNVRGLTC